MKTDSEITRKQKIVISGSGLLFACVVLLFWIESRPDLTQLKDPTREIFYASGELRSRSEMSNELLNGLSEGWYTNGQLQVTEYYVDGVSHGLRTKWFSTGEKKSEAEIVAGQIHGRYRRWYENGQLADDAGFSNGIPHGLSLAYFESGFLKAEVTMKAGTVVEQNFWKDGERRL